jgi:hypothetical protein
MKAARRRVLLRNVGMVVVIIWQVDEYQEPTASLKGRFRIMSRH